MLLVVLAGTAAGADPAGSSEVNLDYPYAINLFSSQAPIDPTELPPASLFKGYRLYQTEYRGKGVLWHRLRLGFFPSRKAAEKKLAELRDHFPRGWVARVSKEERLRSAGLVVTPGRPVKGRRARAAQAALRKARGKGLWALTLFISPKTPRPEDIPALPVFRKYKLYTATFRGKAKSWKVLRMGFFSTRDEAEKMRTALDETFPQAMVMQVPLDEKKVARKNALRPAGEMAEGASLGRKKVKLSKKKAKTVEQMLKDAKKAMTSGKNRKAIAILSKVLKYPENKYSEEALELLGVAYERAGKESKAIAIYKEYLMFYPHGEGAKRVGQRLAGLETARARPRKSTLRKRRSREINELYGTLSQFYNRDASYTDLGGSVLNRSSVSTDLDITYRRRTADYDIHSVFIGGYEYDFLNDSEGRISRMYVDVLDRNRHVSARVGRQWYSTGGVLGRFDGALLSYSRIPRVKFNLVTGYPADSSTITSINTDKNFIGLNVDLGTFLKHWDFNVFGINQRVDGITDRRAVGGEARYNYTKGSYFSLVDYDVSYGRLNTFLFVGNWLLPKNRTVNFSMDYRLTPSLSTSNAIIGQTVNSVSELLNTMSEDEVRALALDRTASNWSATLGGTTPLNKKYQLSGTFTVSELTGTEASGGVAKVPGTGPEYFYSIQLIANSLILKNDLVIAGIRYSDTSTANTTTFSLNGRYTYKRVWRINPRMLVDYSKNNDSVGSQIRIRPTLRTEYHWKKRFHLEFEGGLEWIYDRNGDQTDYTRDYFIVAGYRLDF
jgi:tetratricopeptide (TPR) repeat protein